METVRSAGTDINKAIIMSAIFLAIAAPCILYVKGVIAMIFIVLYCLGAAISSIGILSQIFNPKGTGIQIGLYVDQNGKRQMSMERYDWFINIYEKRYSSPIFWLSCIVALSWLVVFLAAGIEILAYIAVGLTFVAEIGRYKVYKAIKANKTGWGAAMYINEIQNFFEEKK